MCIHSIKMLESNISTVDGKYSSGDGTQGVLSQWEWLTVFSPAPHTLHLPIYR